MNLIHDTAEFERFVTHVMPALLPGEVYMVSLSARNKYLTEYERGYYALGRTEMFARTIGYGEWNKTMTDLFSKLANRTTKNGSPFPLKSLVVYVNINPSNAVTAAGNFAQTIIKIQTEMIASFMAGNTPNLKSLDKGQRLFLNEVQKTTGTRHYVDIDVDADEDLMLEFQAALSAHGTKHHLIQTRGGWHFTIDRESRNETNFPLHTAVKELHKEAVKDGGEVIFNKNAMVPMPGTLQGGKLVRLIY